ncbi:MAG: hypothetical protein Q7T56_07285 [Nocardioidaceae bacterium]|nr:hypothetical protein [Nocardioidaceae bacterium]
MRLSEELAEQIAVDALKEALESATRGWWLKRAADFERAMHRPGDFAGLSSVEQIEDINARLKAKADACRAHAGIAPRWVEGISDLDSAEAAA